MRSATFILAFLIAGCGGATASDKLAPGDGGAGGQDDPASNPEGSSGAGAAVDAGSPYHAVPPYAPTELAHDIVVEEVAMFQGVKVSLARDGGRTTERIAPVVSGRDGLLRVYVAPAPGWKPHKVTAELALVREGSAPVVLQETKRIAAASTDNTLASTFNFKIDGAALTPTSEYAVVLKSSAEQPPGSAEGAAYPVTFPVDGARETFGARRGGVLNVKLVPVRYDADGSKRLPDTSPSAIEKYRSIMYALYPATRVEISVRAPMPWADRISANGAGWREILEAAISLRAADKVPAETYYYAVFMPTSTFGGYCGRGCTAGLSGLLSNPTDSVNRASVGLGYRGEGSAFTMAHEIGHAHGRRHAPCGVRDPDAKYPYKNGAIGVWGYDLVDRSLVDPAVSDMMGYCPGQWISDYTYGAIFNRMALVNASAAVVREGAPQRLRFVQLGGDGRLRWGSVIETTEPPLGEPHPVEYVGDDGARRTVVGHYYPYEDAPGGYLLVPEPSARVELVRVAGLPLAVDAILRR